MKDDRYNRKDDDPFWYINQACAANWHDISRMRRKTCVTTKLMHELQRHLWLYVAHRNGYERDLFDPFFAVTTLKKAQERFLHGERARLAG